LQKKNTKIPKPWPKETLNRIEIHQALKLAINIYEDLTENKRNYKT